MIVSFDTETLFTLNLEGNRIGIIPVKHLARALRTNTVTRVIFFSFILFEVYTYTERFKPSFE